MKNVISDSALKLTTGRRYHAKSARYCIMRQIAKVSQITPCKILTKEVSKKTWTKWR